MPLSPDIERHRKPLARIVGTLFAMIGLAEEKPVARLPSSLYRAVLRVLLPAEAAVRRLVVVAARGLSLPPPRAQIPPPTAPRAALPKRAGRPRRTFRLFDPRPRFHSAFSDERPRRRPRNRLAPRPGPCLRVIDVSFDPRVPLFLRQPENRKEPEPPPPPPGPDGTINAAGLCRRLLAIRAALDDVPRQARRYLRWQSKPAGERRPAFASALRRGQPPGFRKNPRHKVDEILAACDWLARHPPPTPDTS
jgi:hypothetical protein